MKMLPVLVMVLAFLPAAAFADGGIIPDYYTHLHEPEQKAIIVWDGTTETMLLSTKFTADRLGNMAWIVPLESSTAPEVNASSPAVFLDFVQYFVPPRASHKGLLGATAGRIEVFNVTEIKKVDIYDITIIKTTDEQLLLDWLDANGYVVPEGIGPVLSRYAGLDRYFMVNRIDMRNKYADDIDEMVRLYPDFENLTFAEQYRLVRDKYYSDQDSHLSDLSNAYGGLAEGFATPLEIKFTPPKPTFPLAISSINSGPTNIDVYVAAETAMEDSNGIMSVDQSLTISDDFRSEATQYVDLDGAKAVTRLTYVGDLSDLDNDAVFVSSESAPEDVNFRAFVEGVESFVYDVLDLLAAIITLPFYVVQAILDLFTIY